MREWYRPFYGQQYADSVRELLTEERSAAEVDFILELTSLRPPAAIADVCCGNGRHARVLARKGFAVTGVDLNPELLAEGRRLAGNGPAPRFVAGDMRDPVPGPCDLVLSLFNSFGFLDDAGNLRVLAAWSAELRPGGMLLIDLWNRDGIVRNFQAERTRRLARDMDVTEAASFDPLAGRLDIHYTDTYTDGRTGTRFGSFRVYAPSELRLLLASVGLEVASVHGSLNGAPYSLDAPRLVVLAQRPG